MDHGNAKSEKPFYPTLPSTVQRIKTECTAVGPKEVVASVSGGVVGANYPGELPRNEQQVSNFKKHKPNPVGAMHVHTEANELYTVMLQAHLEETDKLFARDIKAYPEPAILLASQRQLNDVSIFCCDSFEYSVLTVDPTFSLGDFDVTPTTYRHLLERNRTGKPPVMIGPTLIHYRKTFSRYMFFASSMIGLEKNPASLRAFGTDGEKALSDDFFLPEFNFAQQLTCFIHVRRNIKEELTK